MLSRTVRPARALFLSAILLAGSCATNKVDAVIGRYYRAIGGYDQLKAIRSLHLVGAHQENGMTINFDFAWQRPNVRRVNWRLSDSLYGAEGFDGQRPWEVFVGEAQVRTLEGDKAAAARRGAEFDESFVDYRTKGHQVAWIGREQLDGREVDHLRVTLTDGWIKDYYFDVESGLIAALSKSMPVHGEGDTVQSLTRYQEYRDVAGVLWPHAAEERDARTGAIMSSDRWTLIEPNLKLRDEQLRPPSPAAGTTF